jgi:hypothetical protein
VVVVGENDERKKRLTGENNLGWGLIFLPSLGSHFFLFRTWNPLLFIGGWKRDILSLLVSNLGSWFEPEGSQP